MSASQKPKDVKQGKIPDKYCGQRLDRALEWILPSWSLRQRRSLWKVTRVWVEGIARSKGYKVQTGQEVYFVLPRSNAIETAFPFLSWPDLRIVAEHNGFAALYKPAGLHCQALDRGKDETLEDALPFLFVNRPVTMLNRLDKATSGLVLLALDTGTKKQFYQFQQSGKVSKYYWALVCGELREEMTCKWKIESSKRRKVRVNKEENNSYLRWTKVKPMKKLDNNLTLVQAEILKGQRHQIRAHLSFAGFPIVGDTLYGQAAENDSLLFLHHYQVLMPLFSAKAQPDWPGISFA
jgi:23S rRNA pseudouridine1911/1915/1917 synthase